MAGIPPVNYNGREYNIDKSNAKMLYVAYRKGELKLDDSSESMQVQRMESLLTPADWDEIDYDMDLRKKEAASNINTEGTEKGEGATTATAGTATAATGAAVTGTCMAILQKTVFNAETSKWSGGFASLLCAGLVLAGGAVALALSFLGMFDPNSGDRVARSDESEATNGEIQEKSDLLEETMEMMDEDVEEYEGQSEAYAETVNGQAGSAADLQVKLKTAEACGDKQGAEALRAQLQQIQGQDFDDQIEEMEETKGRLDAYAIYNAEAQGVSEAGTSVSDFLKVGNTLAPVATLNGTLLGLCTIAIGIAMVLGAIPKFAPFFPDGPAAISSSVVWGAAGLMMAAASTKMFNNAKIEGQCGDNGDTMAEYVNNLNSMIEQQAIYSEDTTGSFEKTDEDTEKTTEKGQEAAQKFMESAPGQGKKKQEENEGSGAGAGSGGGGGGGIL